MRVGRRKKGCVDVSMTQDNTIQHNTHVSRCDIRHLTELHDRSTVRGEHSLSRRVGKRRRSRYRGARKYARKIWRVTVVHNTYQLNVTS